MLIHKNIIYPRNKAFHTPNAGVHCAPRHARGLTTSSRVAAVQIRAQQEQFGLVSNTTVLVSCL